MVMNMSGTVSFAVQRDVVCTARKLRCCGRVAHWLAHEELVANVRQKALDDAMHFFRQTRSRQAQPKFLLQELRIQGLPA